MSGKLTIAQLIRAAAEGKLTPEAAEKQIAAQAGGNGKPFAIEVGEYEGNATLRFSGPFKPWTKGARTVRVLLDNREAVEKALASVGV